MTRTTPAEFVDQLKMFIVSTKRKPPAEFEVRRNTRRQINALRPETCPQVGTPNCSDIVCALTAICARNRSRVHRV